MRELPDYKITWVDVKDRWKQRGDCCHNYSLVLIPKKKGEDIIVFKDYAKYSTGYDQGHASPRQYYLETILGSGDGNGDGVSSEHMPTPWMMEYDWEDIASFLKDGKTYSKSMTDTLNDAMDTFPYKTKLSEIKQIYNN